MGDSLKQLKIFLNIAGLVSVILFMVLVFFLFFFTEALMVVSGSMKPFLNHGDRCISLKLSYTKHYNRILPFPLKRQDVVIIHDQNSDEHIIKRIIGLPGERIDMRAYEVFIDNAPLDEPYILKGPSQNDQIYQVPEGKIFVLGDNRSHSRDSREFGFVDITQIRGKLMVCYYPFDRFRFFYPF